MQPAFCASGATIYARTRFGSFRLASMNDLPRLDRDTAESCPASMADILRYLHDEAAPEEPTADDLRFLRTARVESLGERTNAASPHCCAPPRQCARMSPKGRTDPQRIAVRAAARTTLALPT